MKKIIILFFVLLSSKCFCYVDLDSDEAAYQRLKKTAEKVIMKMPSFDLSAHSKAQYDFDNYNNLIFIVEKNGQKIILTKEEAKELFKSQKSIYE